MGTKVHPTGLRLGNHINWDSSLRTSKFDYANAIHQNLQIKTLIRKTLKDYGINLVDQDSKMIIDTLDWKGLAKKDGIQMGDIITEFKIENLDRPSKGIVYPFALIFLITFGYLNYRRQPNL